MPTGDTDYKPRCWNCNALLAEVLTRPWFKRCDRCKKNNGNVPDGGEPQLLDVMRRSLQRTAEVYMMAVAADKAAPQ